MDNRDDPGSTDWTPSRARPMRPTAPMRVWLGSAGAQMEGRSLKAMVRIPARHRHGPVRPQHCCVSRRGRSASKAPRLMRSVVPISWGSSRFNRVTPGPLPPMWRVQGIGPRMTPRRPGAASCPLPAVHAVTRALQLTLTDDADAGRKAAGPRKPTTRGRLCGLDAPPERAVARPVRHTFTPSPGRPIETRPRPKFTHSWAGVASCTPNPPAVRAAANNNARPHTSGI
jgi:hypothetical protein